MYVYIYIYIHTHTRTYTCNYLHTHDITWQDDGAQMQTTDTRLELSDQTCHKNVRRIHICDMTNSCVTWLMHMHNLWQDLSTCTWHDSFIGVTWLIHMCVSVQQVRFDLSICTWVWLIHICDMTPLNVRFSPSGVIWLIHMYMAGFIHRCDMTPLNVPFRTTWLVSYVWHDSFTYVTWLIHLCDMTRFLRVT